MGAVWKLKGDRAHGQSRWSEQRSLAEELLTGTAGGLARLDLFLSPSPHLLTPRKLTASLHSWISKLLGLPVPLSLSSPISTFPGYHCLLTEQLLPSMLGNL